jgi:hypothetical protein
LTNGLGLGFPFAGVQNDKPFAGFGALDSGNKQIKPPSYGYPTPGLEIRPSNMMNIPAIQDSLPFGIPVLPLPDGPASLLTLPLDDPEFSLPASLSPLANGSPAYQPTVAAPANQPSLPSNTPVLPTIPVCAEDCLKASIIKLGCKDILCACTNEAAIVADALPGIAAACGTSITFGTFIFLGALNHSIFSRGSGSRAILSRYALSRVLY